MSSFLKEAPFNIDEMRTPRYIKYCVFLCHPRLPGSPLMRAKNTFEMTSRKPIGS